MQSVQTLTQPGPTASVRWGSSGQRAAVLSMGQHLVPRGCRTEIRQVLGFRSLNTKRMNEQKMFLQLYRVYEVAGVHRTG